MSLICPKCQGKMRSAERDGVTVEVCKQCRGVFLDRGELERLMAAESQFFGLTPPVVEAAPIVDYDRPQRPAKDARRDYDRVRADKLRPKKKRKKTFLEEFFD
ncbi:MAG TPA: zf-TFIIB domain-containing protein [Nakamurella multipartita]|jgi:Zn-finger nucleic acid-binding protein|nr:zf-TFIIB domain-containing protein [Nakamurella multipartita]